MKSNMTEVVQIWCSVAVLYLYRVHTTSHETNSGTFKVPDSKSLSKHLNCYYERYSVKVYRMPVSPLESMHIVTLFI